MVVEQRAVGDFRGNEDKVSEAEWMDFFTDLYTDAAFQKKVKFIIIVCVEVYFLRSVVIIIIEFKIFGEHVLSGLEGGLEVFFHIAMSFLQKSIQIYYIVGVG